MRTILIATFAMLLCLDPAAAAPTVAGRTEFEVLRNGQPFGRHTIVVSGNRDGMEAETNVSLSARLGPVVLYRWEQHCTETWSTGVLTGLNCSTLKDGRRVIVRARRDGERLIVNGGGGGSAFPIGTLPTSW